VIGLVVLPSFAAISPTDATTKSLPCMAGDARIAIYAIQARLNALNREEAA
jgi:hypothetical protein